MTLKHFNIIMQKYCKFYEKDLTPLQMGIWFDAFRLVTPEKFNRQWRDHVEASMYSNFPAIGAIKNAMKDSKTQPYTLEA